MREDLIRGVVSSLPSARARPRLRLPQPRAVRDAGCHQPGWPRGPVATSGLGDEETARLRGTGLSTQLCWHVGAGARRQGGLAGGDKTLRRAAFRGVCVGVGHALTCHLPCPRLGWVVLVRKGLRCVPAVALEMQLHPGRSEAFLLRDFFLH